MADPTNARMRTMNSFFDSPRFALKPLPGDEQDEPADEAEERGGGELEQWNAYIGPPT